MRDAAAAAELDRVLARDDGAAAERARAAPFMPWQVAGAMEAVAAAERGAAAVREERGVETLAGLEAEHLALVEAHARTLAAMAEQGSRMLLLQARARLPIHSRAEMPQREER